MADKKGVSLISFLAERATSIIAFVSVMAFASVVMCIVGAPTDAVILVDFVAFVALSTSLIIEHARDKRFWEDLLGYSESLDSTMHFSELSPRPRTKRQKVAAESAANIVEMSNDELGRLKADAAQTARYLELWVHETKTPLSAAKLIANRIDDKLAATEILAELERIESQVAQALFAAKSNHLESDYSIREVSLIDIASEVCKQNMHLLIELGLSARIEIEPELTVFADPSWTSFIISQIIANSAKYDSTSIQISATAAEAESPDSATILRISDNGCGIPAHDALRIFERGFIGDVGRSHGSATGMGLYLVSDMCAKMGLGLEVSTEEDVGTTVSISFPHDRRRTLMSGQNLSTSHNLTRS